MRMCVWLVALWCAVCDLFWN